jgi:hypothetical protein
VVVGELYPALPDVFVEVRHEALEVFFSAVDAYGKDSWPTQFVYEDEKDVGLRSWFGDVFRETKASGDTGACDRGGGFQEISALHMYFLQWMKFVGAESEFRPEAEWQVTGDNREVARWVTLFFFQNLYSWKQHAVDSYSRANEGSR